MPAEMLERLETFDLIKTAGEVMLLPMVKLKYIQLNRDQMWDGKDAEGRDLRPKYSEDPYFKTAEQAQAYIAWKQKITPNPKRNPDTPNLMINGHYYNSLDYTIEGVFILHTNHWNEGIDIDRKYQFVRGLSPLSKKEFWERIFRDEILAEMFYHLKLI